MIAVWLWVGFSTNLTLNPETQAVSPKPLAANPKFPPGLGLGFRAKGCLGLRA